MSIPANIYYNAKKDELYLMPYKKMEEHRLEMEESVIGTDKMGTFELEHLRNNCAKEISISISEIADGSLTLDLSGTELKIDGTKKSMEIGVHNLELKDASFEAIIFMDQDVIEIFIPSECKYIVVGNQEQVVSTPITCDKQMESTITTKIFELKHKEL